MRRGDNRLQESGVSGDAFGSLTERHDFRNGSAPHTRQKVRVADRGSSQHRSPERGESRVGDRMRVDSRVTGRANAVHVQNTRVREWSIHAFHLGSGHVNHGHL